MVTKRVITDEQLGQLCRRTNDLIRRVTEGTIPLEATMDVLQDIIEGKSETATNRDMVVCGQDGNHCTICHAFFGESDDVCAGGHMIGESYPAPRRQSA